MSQASEERHHDETALLAEMKRFRKELAKGNSAHRKFWMGVATGFGTVIGATLIVAIALFILTQLASIEIIKPFVEQIVHIVENRTAR